jgi:hypothetical protein
MQQSSRFTPFAARLILVGTSFIAVGSTRVARAQPAHEEQNQNVFFDADELNADLGAAWGDPVFPPHLRPPRTQLIRPRVHFLPELLKSVEQL